MVTVSVLFLIETEFSADYYDYERASFNKIEEAFYYIDTIKAGCAQHAKFCHLPIPTWKKTYTEEELQNPEYLDVTYLHSTPVYTKLDSAGEEQTYLVAIDVQFDSEKTKLNFFNHTDFHQSALSEIKPKMIWPDAGL